MDEGSSPGEAAGERQIARLAVGADPEMLPVVSGFVSATAARAGLPEDDADHLARAVEVVARNVIDNAFESEGEGEYEVALARRPGQVVAAVEDRGIPFDYERLEAGEDSSFAEMLRHAFADEARFVNQGRRGNRVELVRDLPHGDVREQLSEDEHREVAAAPAAADDVEIEIRMMRPEESPALARSVWRSYGYSYDWDDIYYPERIRELQEHGLMRSCVATAGGDELVGHLAMRLGRPRAPVGEAGQAVVDPRYRGHHLFPRMKAFLGEEARRSGMYGLYSEATAVHPYSQKGSLTAGAHETGFLLGYIPAAVAYKDIGDERAGRRGTVALMYLRTSDEPEREIHPPAGQRDLVGRVVERSGLRRTLGAGGAVKPPARSRLTVDLRADHNLAFVRVAEPGADLVEIVRARLRDLCLHRVDCIYVDLPLSHPATATVELGGLGFFFGGVIPEASEGDVLRLQYLNNVEPDEATTASDFGAELLGLVTRQRDELAASA